MWVRKIEHPKEEWEKGKFAFPVVRKRIEGKEKKKDVQRHITAIPTDISWRRSLAYGYILMLCSKQI